LLDFTHTTDLFKGSAVKHNDKEIETMRTSEPDRFSSLLFGIGLGASVALVAALLVRKGTRDMLREHGAKSIEHLNEQKNKLWRTTEGIVEKSKAMLSQRCCSSTGNGTEAHEEAKSDG
jgi:gas vesicle protein